MIAHRVGPYDLPAIDGEYYAINEFGLLTQPPTFTVAPNCGITVAPVPLVDWRVALLGIPLLLLLGLYWHHRRLAGRPLC